MSLSDRMGIGSSQKGVLRLAQCYKSQHRSRMPTCPKASVRAGAFPFRCPADALVMPKCGVMVRLTRRPAMLTT